MVFEITEKRWFAVTRRGRFARVFVRVERDTKHGGNRNIWLVARRDKHSFTFLSLILQVRGVVPWKNKVDKVADLRIDLATKLHTVWNAIWFNESLIS